MSDGNLAVCSSIVRATIPSECSCASCVVARCVAVPTIIFFLLEKLLSSNAQCSYLFLGTCPQLISECRQFVSAKLRLAAVNYRERFVRFECYMKYLQESIQSNKFLDRFRHMVVNITKSLVISFISKIQL